MSKYTSGKTTQKRDKCIQRKSSEISALKAEIDALKAQNAELMAALESIVAKNAIYHRLNDNHKWTLSKHQHDGIQEAIDLIAKINGNQEIAKARGESV